MGSLLPHGGISAQGRAQKQRQKQGMAQSQNGTPPPPVAPITDGGLRYFLQAGSYPDGKGADEAKAKLALLGFTARVQPITINGKTWNRVRVGPYASASELETAKKSLADAGINAIALKEAASP